MNKVDYTQDKLAKQLDELYAKIEVAIDNGNDRLTDMYQKRIESIECRLQHLEGLDEYFK